MKVGGCLWWWGSIRSVSGMNHGVRNAEDAEVAEEISFLGTLGRVDIHLSVIL